MGNLRRLTRDEIALARPAFGERIRYDKVRLSEGPGRHPFAHMAFAKGNTAITIGSTVYFNRDFCPDFTARGQNRKCFMHEMVHVWQYQSLGMAKFFARYGADFARAAGKASDMYKYQRGRTRFEDATIEAQAEMVSAYSQALWARDDAGKAKIARNLAGSGIYAL